MLYFPSTIYYKIIEYILHSHEEYDVCLVQSMEKHVTWSMYLSCMEYQGKEYVNGINQDGI